MHVESLLSATYIERRIDYFSSVLSDNMNDARGTIPPGPPGAPQMGRVPFSRHHAPLASGQPLRDSHQVRSHFSAANWF